MTRKFDNPIGGGDKPNQLYLLQIYRGLAAVIVVCFHASLLLHEKVGSSGYGWFLSWGFSGVHIFFVLSGFIICLIHFGDVGKPGLAKRYLYKRFVRIYPVYWLILLFGVASFLIDGKSATWFFYLENISLLRITNHDKLVSVAWTLSHEILFYLVFLSFIISRRIGVLLLSIWLWLIFHFLLTGEYVLLPYTISRLTGIEYGVFTNFSRLVGSPINLLFAFGVASYLLYRALISHPDKELFGAYGLIIGLVVFFVASTHWLYSRDGNHFGWGGYNAIYGLAAFFLMLGMLSSKADAWSINQPVLLKLGDASYSIYLVHYGLQKFIVNNYGTFQGMSIEFSYIGLVFVSIMCGLVFYQLGEAPLLRLFGRGAAAYRQRTASRHDSC